ncbi:MAG: class I tRNA ligase family protein, partial [Alphaproteobacteria bacterium]
WFDSGSTHAFVLEDRDDLTWPADLYLEGSDQHRGWFQSSLLESCGTRGRAPYRQVLTHGFVVDENGRKMSKSLGNTIEPETLIRQYGAEILRLWTASADFTEDLRLGNEIVKSNVDAYRKLRNTMRFLLGSLAGFSEEERISRERMPELERFILHRLSELDTLVREAYEVYDLNRAVHALFQFCTVDLSAFYFDIRKDSLYCDRPDAERRRACRTVLDELFHRLTVWLAPVLCFTMEEVWQSRFPDETNSVHLRTFPDTPNEWHDEALAEKWQRIRKVRRVVTGALEVERREKRIGSSLEAAPDVYVADDALAAAFEGVDLAEVCITSQARLVREAPPENAFALEEVRGVGVVPKRAEGRKCARSWKVLPEVGTDENWPDLSPRDADAVQYLIDRGKWKPQEKTANATA